MTGEVLGGYVLHEVVGWGAVGQVYRATDPRGAEVAVKVLRPELAHDPEVVARFLRERAILAGIDHPRVVKVRDLIEEPGTLAIVTDFVAGPNLRGHLAGATLPPAEATRLIVQVLEGLTAVHGAGVVHRDVKPENVLVDTTTAPGEARLSDFGIARLTRGPSLTRLTGLIGTPGYLAPELSQREHATPAADIYSTGIMLYELVTGTTPFATGVDPVAVLLAAREKVPGRVPGFPDRLWDVFAAMTARVPGDRPDAAGAARALEAVAAGLTGLPALPRRERPPEPEVPEPERATVHSPGRSGSRRDPGPDGGPGGAEPGAATRRPGRRRRALIAVVGLALAVAGSVMAIALTRSPPASSVTFPLSVLSGTVAAGRTWRLQGTVLTGRVTLTNAGSSTQTVIYDEVIPTTVARSAGTVRHLQPPAPQVVEADPVLRFTFPDVGPGQSRTLSYQATVPASGPAAAHLGRLVADQMRAQTEYLARTNLAVRQLTALDLTPASLVLAAGASQDLVLSGTMNDGSAAPAAALGAAWSSSRPDIASVTSGTVHALAAGTATVRALVGTYAASATVTVANAGTGLPSATAPPPAPRPAASGTVRPPPASPSAAAPTGSPLPAPATPLPGSPARTTAPPPAPPPPNRTAIASYDRMAPGAPYWGRSPYGYQSFTAQSNTLTYVGVTWGSGNYQPGSAVAGVTARIRICRGIGAPGTSDVACNGQVADVAAPVVNYGNSAVDIGDVAVTPGATYYVVYSQPSAAAGSWDLFWWSCACPPGRNSAAASDQNQMVVKGYNR